MNSDDQNGFLGILMLDTSFPRILGDAGNVNSYPFPAKTLVVEGAGSLDIVQDGRPTPLIISRFISAAQQLEQEGARAIISTCGFLISIQDEIAASVDIPVMVSSLSLYQSIKTSLGIKNIGILTASSSDLGESALKAAGIDRLATDIIGFEDCEAFTSAILQPKNLQPDQLDIIAIERAAVKKVEDMLSRCPNLGAIILECGNLPPYADAISQTTTVPVFSILDAATMFMQHKTLTA